MPDLFAWLGSPQVTSLLVNMLEQGALFGFLGLGVLITFRFFRFPDLTAEGSYPSAAPWWPRSWSPGSTRSSRRAPPCWPGRRPA